MATSTTARAGLLSFGGTGTQMLIQVCSLVVLARLLSPTDFGVYAMAMTVIGFTALFRDLGLSAAAVQAKELSRQVRDNLWWINASVGFVLMCAAIAAAPAASRFYGESDVVLVMLLMAPTLLLTGMSVQFGAGLMREMRFGVLAALDVAGGIVGLGVAVIAASTVGGAWALAMPQLVAGLVSLVGVAVAARWRPGRPKRGHGTRKLFGFGAAMFASQLLTYAHRNVDAVLMGRLHGAEWTGMFNRAMQMTRMPLGMLAGPFTRMSLATMAPYQDDRAALESLARKGQVLLALPVLLIAGGLVAAADSMVRLVLGDGWSQAVLFVQLLAASEAFALMGSVGGWLIQALGLGKKLVILSVISATVKITFIAVGAAFGHYGIVIGALAAQIVLWPTSLALAGRLTGIPTGRLVTNSYVMVLPIALATGVGWWVGSLVGDLLPKFTDILVVGASMALTLLLIAVIVQPFRENCLVLLRTARSGLR